ISEPVAFADAATFAAFRFNTTDSLSLQFKALQLFQRLLQFHLGDTQKEALADVDIERVEYINDKSTANNKEDLYKTALERMTGQYGNMPVGAQAWYLLASWYANKAGRYEPLKSDSNRYAYIPAKEICERVMAQKDASE